MKEQEYISERKDLNGSNAVVKYIFKPASLDKKHLVIIFTGFAEKYSFINVGKLFQCNVIWIRDLYKGMECYYLGNNGNFHFSEIVNELIEKKIEDLDLTKKECTLLGGSKGGFSSLYFGLKFDYHNIISCAPTSRIGERMVRIRPKIAEFVMGVNYDKSLVEEYNNLIESLVKKATNLDKNIYLFLSKDDAYYKSHQEYLLPQLKKFSNLNVVMINSSLVYQHNRVTGYGVPLIVSFITANIEGIPFKFGYKEVGNKYKYLVQKTDSRVEPIVYLDKVSFIDNALYLKGVAFFKGDISQEKYERKLILKGKEYNITYSLETIVDKTISSRFFDNFYIDYSQGGFKLLATSLSLEDLKPGVYSLLVNLSKPNTLEHTYPLLSNADIESKFILGAYEYRVWSNLRKVFLSKRELLKAISVIENRETFILDSIFVDKELLFIEGHYSIVGIEAISWGDIKYYLNLYSGTKAYSYSLGLLHQPKYNDIVDEGYGIYQKAVFATLKKSGINLESLPDGIYDLEIVLSYKGSLFSNKLSNKLKVKSTLFSVALELL